MKVLVTGAEGFIGRNLSLALAEAGDEVFYGSRKLLTSVDESHNPHVDLLNQTSIQAAIEDTRPDVIVNCAGIVDASQDFDNNRVFTRNILIAAHTSGQKIRRIIICSSAGVYGQVEPSELPVKETTPLRANSAYGLSKIAEEAVARDLGAKYGIPITIARIFNPIGSGMAPKYLVSNILRQLEECVQGERTELELSRLDTMRDYVAIEDVAQAIKAMVHGNPGQTVYNVGSGAATSNGQLVKLILSNYDLESYPTIRQTVDVPEPLVASQADITKLQEDLGWMPSTPLEDSIKRIVYEAKQRQ